MMLEVRPTSEAMFAGEGELRVGECDTASIVKLNARVGGRVAGAVMAKKFLGLFLELFEGRPRGKAGHEIGHNDLLSIGPRPHDGLKEDRNETGLTGPGGLGPFPRTGSALRA